MSFFRTAVLLFVVPAVCSAQGLRGEVVRNTPIPANLLLVEAYSEERRTVVERAFVTSTGTFEFHGLATGHYALRVVTQSGEVVTTADVNHQVALGPVQILLPDEKNAKPVSGVTSVAAMRNIPAKKALVEFRKSKEAEGRKDAEGAMAHLRAAIAISPNFAEAHTNLGALLTQDKQYEEAAREFETVLRVGTAGAAEHLNLSVALFALKRFEEGEAAVREALRVDASNAKAHYLLGRVLLRQRDRWEEARRNLQLAAKEIPAASSFLAQMNSLR